MNASSNIRKLYIIKMAKWFMLTMPILMLYYKDNGFTDAQAFQLKACYSIAIVIFEVPSGYFADVLGRKMTLVVGAVMGTLGFLIYSVTDGFFAFMFAEIILGIGQSFVSGADSAMLYDTLNHFGCTDQYLKYEGRHYSIGNYAESLAGVVGGTIATFSLHLPFVLQTAIAFTAVPAALTLFEPPAEEKRERPGLRDIFKVIGYATITSSKLRYNLLISSLLGTATLTMAWVYQLYLKDIGFANYSIGMVHAGLNLLVGTSVLFAHRLENRLGPRGTVWLVSVVITSAFMVLGFIESAWALGALVLFYMARGIATPVLKYYVNRITTSDMRATILSLRSLIIRTLFAVLAPLYGWTSDVLGRARAMQLLGFTFTVLVAIVIPLFFKSLSPDTEDGPAMGH
jgi:MFS family permease